MREPLDLERPREQLCPVCHDRGWFKGADRYTFNACTNPDCSAGKAYRYAGMVRQRLGSIGSPRSTELWLQTQQAALGGERPINVIREGRGEEVMAVLDAIPGIAPRGERAVVEPPQPPEPVALPPDPKAVVRVLASKLRLRGERRIANALELGNLSGLTDKEYALLDAAMSGTGFLVNGVRVDPDEVEVVRWPS